MLVDRNDKRYGIEVKSTKSSLYADEAYITEITRGGKGEKIRTIPIYTVGCRFPYHINNDKNKF